MTFMLKVRHGKNFESGLVVTGFWLGLTCGRVILGFVTGKIGEKIAIAVYMVRLVRFSFLQFGVSGSVVGSSSRAILSRE